MIRWLLVCLAAVVCAGCALTPEILAAVRDVRADIVVDDVAH